MNDFNLDDIEARAEAATKGPWRMWDGWGPTGDGLMGFARLGPPTGERVFVHDDQRDLYATRADAEFIAAARTDVPALVWEVRQLRARLNLSKIIGYQIRIFDKWYMVHPFDVQIVCADDTPPERPTSSSPERTT